MKKILLIPLLLAGLALANVSEAQLATGASTTNLPCTAGTNWSPIALSRADLITRSIVNTNATSDLIVSYTLPVVTGSTKYNSFITSNIYNSTVTGLQTNIPPNVVVTADYASTLNFKVFVVTKSTTTNVTIGAELYGTFTNNADTINTTNRVFVSDVYLQR